MYFFEQLTPTPRRRNFFLRGHTYLSFSLGAFLLWLTYDFTSRESNQPVRLSADTEAGHGFDADVKVAGLTYDVGSRTITGQLTLKVRSHSQDPIETINVSYQRNEDGSASWWPCTPQPRTCEFAAGMYVQDEGEFDEAEITMPVTLRARNPWIEVFYPFDEYPFVLALRACVNANVCVGHDAGAPVVMRELQVDTSDANFTLVSTPATDPTEVGLSIQRKYFVRIVSLFFLWLCVIVLWNVVRSGEPKDLMQKSLGFFAALWGIRSLLVPTTIRIFPTAVDYVVLTMFCVLFACILIKLANHER